MDELRIAIIEDQRELRDALLALVSGTPGLRCTGAFGSMEDALFQVASDSPDIVLVDIGLPGMSGTEGIPHLRERCPEAVPVILTNHDDDDRIFAAMCAGAGGYLLKKTSPARLLECLQEARDGGAPVSPEVARRMIGLFQKVQPPKKADYNLTPHEQRLLQMLVEGENYKTAAGALGVSPNTISFHMRNIYRKLHVHSKSEAVAKALRNGVV